MSLSPSTSVSWNSIERNIRSFSPLLTYLTIYLNQHELGVLFHSVDRNLIWGVFYIFDNRLDMKQYAFIVLFYLFIYFSMLS